MILLSDQSPKVAKSSVLGFESKLPDGSRRHNQAQLPDCAPPRHNAKPKAELVSGPGLRDTGVAEPEIEAIEQDARRKVDEATEICKAAPAPSTDLLTSADVYADGGLAWQN